MTLAADVINRVLERESWARERLVAHAGRTVQIDIGPASRTLFIAADGRFSDSEAVPDLTLTISPLRLPMASSVTGTFMVLPSRTISKFMVVPGLFCPTPT